MPRRRPSSCSGELMANAWIIEPLPVSGWGDTSTSVLGQPSFLTNDHAGVVFRALASGGNGHAWYVNCDLGRDRTIDTVALFGLSGVPASATASVTYATEAQGFFTGQYAAWNEPTALAGSAPMTTGRGVGLFSSAEPVVARYVQLAIFLPELGGIIEAARLVIGRRIALDRNFSFGAGFGVKDLGSLEFSRRGVLLRNRGAKLRTTSLSFSSVRKDEVEQLTKPLLERIGNTECVALVTDPAPDAQRQNRCYFGPLVGDLSQTWRRAGAWEAKINMVSIF